jgi:hypothetical protein
VTPSGSLNADGTGIDNEGTIVLSGGAIQLIGTGPCSTMARLRALAQLTAREALRTTRK